MSPSLRRNARRSEEPEADDSYWLASRRPLQILAFLLPLIVAYEVCLALVLPAEDGLHVSTVEAHRTLLRFFAAGGVAPTGGLYLGGLLIAAVLLAWHVLAGDRWRVDPLGLLYMALEATALTVPLIIFSRVITAEVPAAMLSSPSLGDLDVWSQMAISVGAGLYEELVFRMILIAVVHTLLVDLARTSEVVGTTIAIVLSAVAFTWYHDLSAPGGVGGLSGRKVVFYFGAGLYFGLVYTLRGFGLVVATHALYDVITVVSHAGGSAAE